jgi:hypothetical protein
MAEPPEDAIDEFVNFTSTTREQAISFLKVRTAPQTHSKHDD